MDQLLISKDVLARELAGEILVLDLRTSLYFGMTDVAARVWQLVEQQNTRDVIVETLAKEFDAAPDVIATDVDTFLEDLLTRGLLVRATA
jgi:hypothetical protein